MEVKTSTYYGTRKGVIKNYAIFNFELANKNVYMSVGRELESCDSNFARDDLFVVIVKADKFVQLWSLEPNKFNGNPISDRIKPKKYDAAIQGFSYGISNPVPLANVICKKYQMQQSTRRRFFSGNSNHKSLAGSYVSYVDFINGITRTRYLLDNGVNHFPILCSKANGAELLAEECGYGSNAINSVSSLLNIK